MFEDLKIISWPDPRLLKLSSPVETFNDDLGTLAMRMIELMRAAKGVGLAAPQVGQNIRLFVIGPTGNPEDERVYVNPVISDLAGDQEGEEGCLSLPGITAKIVRADSVKIDAHDLSGRPVQDVQTQYLARIWQHEFDHLNGKRPAFYVADPSRGRHSCNLRIDLCHHPRQARHQPVLGPGILQRFQLFHDVALKRRQLLRQLAHLPGNNQTEHANSRKGNRHRRQNRSNHRQAKTAQAGDKWRQGKGDQHCYRQRQEDIAAKV